MNNYDIKYTEDMGRCIITRELLLINSIVMRCELLVLNENDTKVLELTDLKYYTFKYNDTQDCLVLGNGELFNHSNSPNVGYRLVHHDNRKVMEFFALSYIDTDVQLFIDYNADSKINISSYQVNLIKVSGE